MKSLVYRLSAGIVLIVFVILYGMLEIFDPFNFKVQQNWSLLKWAGIGLAVGIGALVLEGILGAALKPMVGSDRTTDPLWKRGLRASALIILFAAVIIGVAAVQYK